MLPVGPACFLVVGNLPKLAWNLKGALQRHSCERYGGGVTAVRGKVTGYPIARLELEWAKSPRELQ